MKDEIGKLSNSEDRSISFTTELFSEWYIIAKSDSPLDKWFIWEAICSSTRPEMSHTAEYIASCISTMLDICHNRVYLVLNYNVSNMVKAMQDAPLLHFSCFAHSLQLVVKDG